MKIFFKYYFVLFISLMGITTFSSCDDDDDPVTTTASSIVGMWKIQGSTNDHYQIMTFKSDGNGVIEDEEGSMNFKYTYSYDSSTDKGSLKYWFLGYDKVYNATITITGSTMMMTKGSSVTIWNKI